MVLADIERLKTKAAKLMAEARRFDINATLNVCKFVLAVFAAAVATYRRHRQSRVLPRWSPTATSHAHADQSQPPANDSLAAGTPMRPLRIGRAQRGARPGLPSDNPGHRHNCSSRVRLQYLFRQRTLAHAPCRQRCLAQGCPEMRVGIP